MLRCCLLYTSINNTLANEKLDCWILFDKLDELFYDDYPKRKLCVESLFRIYLKFINRFPRIKFKIFLRNDIWSTLEFVNKSHISDKCVELSWSENSLLEMLMRRVLNNEKVMEYVINETGLDKTELLSVSYTHIDVYKRQVWRSTTDIRNITAVTAS